MKVFLDTSGIVAAMNAKDNCHHQAKEIFLRLATQKCSLIITNYIRAETHALLINRASREIALKFLDEKSWAIEWISPEDEQKAIQLIHQYSDKVIFINRRHQLCSNGAFGNRYRGDLRSTLCPIWI